MTEPLRFGALAILLMLGLTLSGCMHIPDAAESAELAKLREDYACNPPYGYRAIELVAERDVPLSPKPINRSFPEFPRSALGYVRYGEVKTIIAVNEAGNVERVDVTSESPRGCRFAEATVRANMRMKFAPGAPGEYALIATFKLE